MKSIRYVLIWAVFSALLVRFDPFSLGLIAGEPRASFVRLVVFSSFFALAITIGILIVWENKRIAPFINKLVKFRSLLYQLVRRDFLSKYKRSVLGVAWSVLNPLLTMIILMVVFSTLFRFDIPNFPVYLLSGQVLFIFFSAATSMSMSSVVGASTMLRKVSLPKYIFPLSRVISCLVDLAFSFISLIAVILITRAPLHWTMLLSPIAVLYVFLFSLGIGMILSAMYVFFRDLTYLYGLFITALTYFTPLFYPVSIIPDRFVIIISANPMYQFVKYFRNLVLDGTLPTLEQNIICVFLCALSLFIGFSMFYKLQDRFILYI